MHHPEHLETDKTQNESANACHYQPDQCKLVEDLPVNPSNQCAPYNLDKEPPDQQVS